MKFTLASMKSLAALGALAMLAQAGDYSTWARHRTVTLSTSGMGLSAGVANFPVLVRFKASTHKDMLDSAATQVQANGSDIRVTLADGTTDVPFEIEHVSTGADGRLHLWILAANVPANSASAATFRVYWGKTGETSMSNPMATFPTSAGYRAVFHLNETGTTGVTVRNSADTTLNGTTTGTVVTTGTAAGQGFVTAKGGLNVRRFGNSTGGVDNSTAATHYIQFSPGASHILSTHSGPITMEAWIYSSITNSGNTSPGTKHIIAHGDGNTGGKAWFARTAALDGSGCQNHYSAGGPNNIAGPIAPFGEQHHWQFVTAVWNGTNWAIYRNRENDFWNNPTVAGPEGMLPDSATYKILPGVGPTASTNPWFIGAASDNGTGGMMTRGWQGWMDEVRISTVARDSNYVKLTFLTTRADTLAGIIHPVSIGATEVPLSGPYAAWSGHRTIRLNTSATGANVTGNVTNFPVLIRLGTTEASILGAANGGNSIRFSKADDATALPYEIEHWSSNSAAIWVLVDTVYGNNATQSIRMHWGNAAAASQSNPSAVFDTANGFVGVWHMGGTANETDATVNGNTAVAGNAPGTAAGIIGNGRRLLRASSQHFVVANHASLNWTTPAFTLSAWVNAADWEGSGRFFQKGQGTDGNSSQYGMRENSNDQLAIEVNSVHSAGPTNSVPATGTWGLVHARYNGSTRQVYLNGTQILTNNYTTNITTNTDALNIGRRPDGTNFFNGILDEMRVSRVARSTNWMMLEYQNQKDSNSLVDIGLPVYTVPGPPTGVTVTAGPSRGVVSWTAPADNGGRPILSYKATVVGDTALACTTSTLTCTINDLSSGTPYNVVVRAINAVGAGPNSAASNTFTPTAILPGSFLVRMDGAGSPYTYRLPAASIAVTEKLTMTVTTVDGKRVWSRTIRPAATKVGELTWEGKASNGRAVAPGLYVVRVQIVMDGKATEAVQKGVRR